jgi:hypothetical protein
MSPQETIRSFIASPEFADYVGFVARCYFGILNDNSQIDYRDQAFRTPDHGGVEFWSAVMRGLASDLRGAKFAVISGFITSDEWIARMGEIDDSEFVRFAYEGILGRAAEPSGHAYWLGLLQSGEIRREELLLGFVDSGEAKVKFHNHTYVAMCYLGLLDRASDPGGFTYWVDLMFAGAREVDVIGGFSMSQEYAQRLSDLGCAAPVAEGE